MKPPCFPMRPAFGPRPVAQVGWIHQPKLNGWRALLHVGSGELWSRQGRPLRHAEKWAANVALLTAALGPIDLWLDCEAMGIRTLAHNLTVLDVIMPGTLAARRAWLEAQVDPWLVQQSTDPDYIMAVCRAGNGHDGELVYEGVVSKLEESPYDMQNVSARIECQDWIKWRFA